MSSISPWNQCLSILTSKSATEISKLIDSLELESPDVFRKLSCLGICRDSWKAGKLSEHDFMHRVKATVDNTLGDKVRQEAHHLVSDLIQNQRKMTG